VIGVDTLVGVGRASRFAGRSIAVLPRTLRQPGLIVDEIWNIGVASLPVVGITAIFAGTVLAVQGFATFKQFGAQDMVGLFVALAGVREMAPILAAAMVSAKAGAAITSDIAAMKNGQQIDALEVMAVDPLERLIAPKLIAALIALPALTIISDFLTVTSAAVVSTLQLGVEKAYFLANVETYLAPSDLYKGLLKALVFGSLMWITSCWQGMNAGPGPEGVGRATNRAIVIEVLGCLILNVFLTAWLYRV
jgi:phospholipid/cholesterol/gamma-HCH transport system permease protein